MEGRDRDTTCNRATWCSLPTSWGRWRPRVLPVTCRRISQLWRVARHRSDGRPTNLRPTSPWTPSAKQSEERCRRPSGGCAMTRFVLGKSVRIPGSVTSDEELSSHSLAEGQDLEAEEHRQRLELRCQARKAFFEADNSQTIRRAMLRRSNPVRGPYLAGSWVLYWTKKSSPNRLAAGRWHGPAKVICQEGQSVVWVAHGSTILRCAPENLRPASLREWQSLTPAELQESPSRVGGARLLC